MKCIKYIKRIEWLESLIDKANKAFDTLNAVIDDLRKRNKELEKDRNLLLQDVEELLEENKRLNEELKRLRSENFNKTLILQECLVVFDKIEQTHIPIKNIKEKLEQIKKYANNEINKKQKFQQEQKSETIIINVDIVCKEDDHKKQKKHNKKFKRIDTWA